MTQQKSIAIIGAGISGLSAAKTVSESGHAVTLFEKSRVLGGRLATKRLGDVSFDHGAQYFTAHTDRFKDSIDSAIKAGLVAHWELDRYVGTPGMSSFARFLADQRDVRFSLMIETLTRSANLWSLHDSEGQIHTGYDAVFLALPAPQISSLLKRSKLMLESIDQLRYSPCWALMLAFDEATAFPSSHLSSDDPVIAWIAKNDSKPNRASTPETFVIHATPEWSFDHLDAHADDVSAKLLSKFSELTQITRQPFKILAHRWRYARVEEPLGQPFLWDAYQAIGACGDWATGSRIENAFNSGHLLGEAYSSDTASQIKR